MTGRNPGDRNERRRARTRAALLEAAQSLMIRGGSEDVAVADIAEAADVAVATFYNHFESKEALVKALVTETADGLAARLGQAGAGVTDPAVALAVRALAFLGWALDDLDRAGVVLAGAFGQRSLRANLGVTLGSSIHEGQRSGRFSADDLILTTAAAAGALVTPLIVQLEGLVTVDPATVTAQVLRLLGLPPGDAQAVVARAQAVLATG